MATITEIPARGRVIAVNPPRVTFAPDSTAYQLDLVTTGEDCGGAAGTRVEAILRADARKIWTVPSGGNFITPIFGEPRTLQGRIRSLDERTMVVECGAPFIVTLPKEESAIDLANGPLAPGVIVNIVVRPTATFEPVRRK